MTRDLDTLGPMGPANLYKQFSCHYHDIVFLISIVVLMVNIISSSSVLIIGITIIAAQPLYFSARRLTN